MCLTNLWCGWVQILQSYVPDILVWSGYLIQFSLSFSLYIVYVLGFRPVTSCTLRQMLCLLVSSYWERSGRYWLPSSFCRHCMLSWEAVRWTRYWFVCRTSNFSLKLCKEKINVLLQEKLLFYLQSADIYSGIWYWVYSDCSCLVNLRCWSKTVLRAI